MSLARLYNWVLLILSIIFCIFHWPFYEYVVPIFILLIFILRVQLLALDFAWDKGKVPVIQKVMIELVVILSLIFIYSLIYLGGNFSYNNSIVSIDFINSFIFSLQNWLNISHINIVIIENKYYFSVLAEGLLGYLYLAFIFFLFTKGFDEIFEHSTKYIHSLSKIKLDKKNIKK